MQYITSEQATIIEENKERIQELEGVSEETVPEEQSTSPWDNVFSNDIFLRAQGIIIDNTPSEVKSPVGKRMSRKRNKSKVASRINKLSGVRK